MFTIISSIIGLLGSTIPHIFKAFQDGKDKAHELSIMQMQIEFAKLNLQTKLEETTISANNDELKILYSTYESGIRWVDALNGCVRPIIAYSFFAVYFITKLPVLYISFKHENYTLLHVLWTTDDSCIFAGIISFYFGSRAMSKLLK